VTTSYHHFSNRLTNYPRRLPPKGGKGRRLRRRLVFGGATILVLFILLEVTGCMLAQREKGVAPPAPPGPPGASDNRARILSGKNSALQKRIAALAPQGLYLVIDTANNRVYLRKGEQTLKEMVASCGSGNVLEDPVAGRKWTFDTPRGEFQVRSKVTNPIWIKPDWAFIEEGEPIPDKSSERAEPGMMGDYALGLGRGYFIHGTMYKRLLGRNVSHGCVRLGDEDLKALYETANIGTRVIIF
jgi:hypothetical protein